MKPLLTLIVLCWTAGGTHAYDFRSVPAYKRLSPEEREKLEQVHRDLALLKDAIRGYAKNHSGYPPESLDVLVPKYLRSLPKDPFATASTASRKLERGRRPSLGGWGYRYSKYVGYFAGGISSVGLPRFPYRGERNYGLGRAVLIRPSMAPKGIQLIQEEEEFQTQPQ